MKTTFAHLDHAKKRRHYYLRSFAKKKGAKFKPQSTLINGITTSSHAQKLIHEFGYEIDTQLSLF